MEEGRELRGEGRRTPGWTIAALIGGLWGLAGYAALWGHTPITVHRSFVVSGAGTALLLPVRAVLGGIRLVERHVAGRPFDFSQRNAWIGLVSGIVGAAIVAGAFLVGRLAVRAAAARRP